jgi:hypothetical protein
MMRLAALTALLMVGAVSLGACVFDSEGLDPGTGDGAVDLPDTSLPDMGPDTASDTKPTPICKKVPPPAGNVCSGDQIGESGTCQSGAFVRSRYCFTTAPCQGGTCFPQCTGNCLLTPCGSGEICTALFAGATLADVKYCCVTPSSKNGSKDATSSCTKNEECTSGLCNQAGNCFEPCANSSQCPSPLVCSAVRVKEGQLEFDLTGCVAGSKDAGPEAGPDAGPDAGPEAGVDSAVDSAPADAQPADAQPADAQPPDAQPPDAQPPDAQPPDAQPPDAQPPDAQPADAQPPDAQPPDAQPPDAAVTTDTSGTPDQQVAQ